MAPRALTPARPAFPVFGALAPRAGVGLKLEHAALILARRPDLGFVEIHAENFMSAGGPTHALLSRVRERYPLSVHGVGLSLGGARRPDAAHLDRLARLLARYEPQSFSEHLAWSSHGDVYFNDLLPVAYDGPTLARVCDHIDCVQARLGVRMLLENPSTYVGFARATMSEAAFIAEIVKRTGCGLLLDVSNVVVSAMNHGRDPRADLEALPLAAVGEMHLGGYAAETDTQGAPLLIDDHGRAIDAAVWPLYERAIALCGPTPTLIEWDNGAPTLDALLEEAAKADAAAARAPRLERCA